PQFEGRDRLARPGDDRLLSRDQPEVGSRGVYFLRVADAFADAHVEHHLVEPRHLHRIRIAEILSELLGEHLLVVLLEAVDIRLPSHRCPRPSAWQSGPCARPSEICTRRVSASRPWDPQAPDWRCECAPLSRRCRPLATQSGADAASPRPRRSRWRGSPPVAPLPPPPSFPCPCL